MPGQSREKLKIGIQRSYEEVSKIHGNQTTVDFQVGYKPTNEEAGLAKALNPGKKNGYKAFT